MSVLAIDGESKTCKTSVTADIASHLSHLTVVTGDAGRFFRTLDHDAQVEMGTEDIGAPPYRELDAAIRRVIASGTAFDPALDRGDLERPAIANTVAIVAQRPGVQAAGIQWYESTFLKARENGVDALVINGRNPVDRLERILTASEQSVALSMLVYCEPQEAARRVLFSEGVTDPQSTQILDQQVRIMRRREVDRNRPRRDFPYQDPDRVVIFDHGACPYELVDRSRKYSPDRPIPILFDTTEMNREEMRGYAQSLAAAALNVMVET